MSRLLALVALLAMVGSFAVSCGGSVDEVGGLVVEAERPESYEDLEWNSPIQEFLGADGRSGDDMEAIWADQQRQAEQVIAECMRAAGFEYVPRDFDNEVFFGPDVEELPYFSDEWVAKYGFGISTQRFSQSSVGPNLVGYPDEYDVMPDDMPVDPNQEIIDALSEAERDVYFETLHGPPIAFEHGEDGLPSEEMMMWQPQGCEGEAYGDTMPGGGQEQNFWVEFGDEVRSIDERVSADPRVVAFDAEVSECVSAAGHSWDSTSQPWELFENRLAALGPDYDEDPFEAAGLDYEEMSDREIHEFYVEMSTLSEEDRQVLAEIQADEIELAQVVVGCGGGDLNRTWFTQPIRIEYEQEFLNANADQLSEFRSDG